MTDEQNDQRPMTATEHDCLTGDNLAYRGDYGAPGFGQAWECNTCARQWARLGCNEFYPSELGAHILTPEDCE